MRIRLISTNCRDRRAANTHTGCTGRFVSIMYRGYVVRRASRRLPLPFRVQMALERMTCTTRCVTRGRDQLDKNSPARLIRRISTIHTLCRHFSVEYSALRLTILLSVVYNFHLAVPFPPSIAPGCSSRLQQASALPSTPAHGHQQSNFSASASTDRRPDPIDVHEDLMQAERICQTSRMQQGSARASPGQSRQT